MAEGVETEFIATGPTGPDDAAFKTGPSPFEPPVQFETGAILSGTTRGAVIAGEGGRGRGVVGMQGFDATSTDEGFGAGVEGLSHEIGGGHGVRGESTFSDGVRGVTHDAFFCGVRGM